MPPKLILLDTDIGTDVDDCLALALILASPELSWQPSPRSTATRSCAPGW